MYGMVGIQQTRVKCFQLIENAYLVCKALSAQCNHDQVFLFLSIRYRVHPDISNGSRHKGTTQSYSELHSTVHIVHDQTQQIQLCIVHPWRHIFRIREGAMLNIEKRDSNTKLGYLQHSSISHEANYDEKKT